MHCVVPKHVPFSRTKTPYMSIFHQKTRGARCLLADSLDDSTQISESDELYCHVWQKILSNDQVVYTMDLPEGPIIMLNTDSKSLTEIALAGGRRVLTWHGTPGLASTFGSGFFELKDGDAPVALYYSTVSKALAKTRKVGEFIIWEPELADLIVAMGLILREQKQRKNFERNHVVVKG
ncbi:hypothetical protein TRVA0_009S02806 [Trichomonascus vanleenenianus]|uniref:uncharacterized protein n=1 Tax=Trichomonascus vanleenenianus TaxID=2268995 RepID=UPI003EC9A445